MWAVIGVRARTTQGIVLRMSYREDSAPTEREVCEAVEGSAYVGEGWMVGEGDDGKAAKGTVVAQFLAALPGEPGESREDVLEGKFDWEQPGKSPRQVAGRILGELRGGIPGCVVLALLIFLGKMTMGSNVAVGHDMDEGLKRTVKSMPTLLLTMPSGTGKSNACNLVQSVLYLGEGMPKVPEEGSPKEEKVKYAVRRLTGDHVIRGTPQGIRDVLSTHKYPAGKWEKKKMTVLMMPEADTLMGDLTSRSEFRDEILSTVSGESGKCNFATKKQKMDGIVAAAILLPMRHPTLTSFLEEHKDNGFVTKVPMVAVTSETTVRQTMSDSNVEAAVSELRDMMASGAAAGDVAVSYETSAEGVRFARCWQQVFMAEGYMRELKAVDAHCAVLATRRAEDVMPTAHALLNLLSPDIRAAYGAGTAGVWTENGAVDVALSGRRVVPRWAVEASCVMQAFQIDVGARFKNPGQWGKGSGMSPQGVAEAYELLGKVPAVVADSAEDAEIIVKGMVCRVVMKLVRSTCVDSVLPLRARTGLLRTMGTRYGEGVFAAAVRTNQDVLHVFYELRDRCGFEVAKLPRNGVLLKAPPGKLVGEVVQCLITNLPFEEEEREELEEWLRERCLVATSREGDE